MQEERTNVSRAYLAGRRWLRGIRPERRHLRADTVAAMPSAVSSVPDGMASAALIGVSPVVGLYSSIVGPVFGGLTTSTRMMIVSTTTAAALAAASALEGVPPSDRPAALFLLTIIAGALMIGAGLARLGRYTRFVSHSVMTGFLTGVAASIIFGQLSDLAGAETSGDSNIAEALDLLLHLGRVDPASAIVGLATLAILFGLKRTRASSFSALLALLLPTLAMVLFGLDSVAQVRDGGAIPRGIPLPALPELRMLSFELVAGAAAVTVIVLVQGAGVSESAPNQDGSPSSMNKDFIGQGIANVAVGIFRGQPVGGSVSGTALSLAMGARTRWAAIMSGLLLLPIVVLLSGLVGLVPVPVLAGVLIFAAIGAIRPGTAAMIWRTGKASTIAMVATFVATLFLPVAAAVGIGVALSLILQLNQESMDLRIVQLTAQPDGHFREGPGPTRLTSHEATVLDVYGSLLYAGSKTMQKRLPDPAGTEGAAVIIRLRGRTALGATFYRMMADYSRKLADTGGRLYLSGLEPELLEQARRAGGMDMSGPVRALPATEILGESTWKALHEAGAWLVRHRTDLRSPGTGEDPTAGAADDEDPRTRPEDR
ncbi:SulP family inorganic anion transporter [Brachybacterium saurashtrense]|uniref:SulP family inorganic anion transporter n=2 Tax=Brachybacterium saurashtrense TaxID=556288 RepID=A0A345YTB0_9MICO|nr:SulP family inorganic anion transporter [Brachybacterium saurashtrense]RRR21784.1 SulP family inorganic anion transporter [Brachybacterium saurashtrense]